MANEIVLRSGIRIAPALGSGIGDPTLTRNVSTGFIGVGTGGLSTTLTNGNILIGNGSNVATAVPVTGDVLISNTGVTSISSGVIVNADVNASAGIALTKLAATTVSRAIVSDGSGFLIPASTTATEVGHLSGVTSPIQTQLNAKQATIAGAATTITSVDLTANRALISNGIGKVSVHATTTDTQIGYLTGVTSAIQTQLDNRLTVSLTSPATGDLIYYNGSNWVNLPRGTNGQALFSTAGSIQWGAATVNGLPIGGTDGQVLTKQSAGDFDALWETLTVASIPEITASAAELNILDGATLSTTELNYVDGVTSNIQTQLDGKLANSLAQNNIFIGNSSNLPVQLAAGTNGYVLTSVSGVPTWQPVSAGSPPGSDTQVIFNDGGSFAGDAGLTYNKTTDLLVVNTNLQLGDSSVASSSRSITAVNTGNTSQLTLSCDSTMTFTTPAGALLNGASITSTNSVANLLVIRRGTTGTAANGIGSGIAFQVENDAGANISAATLQVVTTDVTSGSEDYDIRLFTTVAGVSSERVRLSGNNLGIGVTSPSARLHLPAGTTAANTAPIKLTSGTAMTTPEDGAIEYHTSHLYFTIGSTRYQLDQQGGVLSGLTTNRIPYATSATTLGDDAQLTWSSTTNSLNIDAIRIHSAGNDNCFMGTTAGNFTVTGTGRNVGIGTIALSQLTSGSNNTAVGHNSSDSITTGATNTALGAFTLAAATAADSNTAIGYSALGITTGNNNIALGYFAGQALTSGSRNIIIGNDIDAQSATGNDQLTIQNIIFGVGNSAVDTSISTGSIGIGEPAPTRKLEIAGSLAIKAGTSTGQIARVPGTINTSTTTTGNVGTGEDTIYSYTVPANVLSTNKDTLVGNIFGTLAANTNSKRFRLKFGATTIMDENLSFGGASAGRWDIDFRIVRTGAATQKCYATLRTSTTGNTYFSYYTTAAETLSGTVVLTLTGEATADNDIVGESWSVKWEPSE